MIAFIDGWQYTTILYWVLGLSAVYFLGLPLLIFFGQKLQAAPVCTEIQMHKLEPQLAQFLMDQTNELYALGFDEPTLIHMPSPVPGVQAYLIMLVNRPAGDKVMITALIGTNETAPSIQTWYVEFSTRYENDHCVDTLNSSELSAFQQGPENIRSQVPSVTSVAELYRLHQYKMKTSGISVRKVVYEPGQAIKYLIEKAIKKSYQEQADKGILRYIAQENCYVPTITGAYRMTWGLMQPMKFFRMLAMRQREQAILAEFRAAS